MPQKVQIRILIVWQDGDKCNLIRHELSMKTPKQSSQTKKAPQKAIEEGIRKIEERYAMGQAILKACGPTSPRGLIAELAEQHGINRDSAQKLRAMAAKETGYTKRELNDWFRLFREEEFVLTISHFVRLISVPKGRERDRLTRESLKHRWSSHRLQAEILARQGRRREGGRKPTVITGEVLEAELEQKMWAWDRWLELHLKANPKLRPEIAKELKAIRRKIAQVDQLLLNRSGGR